MTPFKSSLPLVSVSLSLSVSVSVLMMMVRFLLFSPRLCVGQYTNVALEQGTLVGLKVFPESARTAVYAFLGIPYAQPPTGELRFASPRPHAGWNGTLQATHMRPICPQPTNSVYDETTAESSVAGNLTPDMEEDCLYLNVWVPEVGMRFGNLPVLVILTGEQLTFDWPRNRAIGLDFACEGVVVVTLQYRSNIFGWISLGTEQLAGNYGLQDQQLALQWLQHNVRHFGGNPRQVTLLGHGTSGVPCVLAHWLWPTGAAAENRFFTQIVLMSGGDTEAVLATRATTFEVSRLLIQKLGCHYEAADGKVVKCLRAKSVSDLQKAFESIYDHRNGSIRLGPVLESDRLQGLTNKSHTLNLPPMMLGICSNEAAFMQDYWLHLAREGYASLRSYVNYTLLPNAIRRLGADYANGSTTPLIDTLNWKYFGGEAAASASYLLHAMQRFASEMYYELPFYQLLEHLAAVAGNASSSIYAYVFAVTNAMDLRGKVNLFGGASHSSDLPLLLGPNLFQQIARRRFTAAEEKLCRKMRNTFANFIKTGNPTPGRSGDTWPPYTRDQKFIFSLGEPVKTRVTSEAMSDSAFEQNLAQIEKLLEKDEATRSGGAGLSRSNRNDYKGSYTERPHIRRTKVFSYSTNPLDSSYTWHLKRVYSFWQLLLPNIVRLDGGQGSVLTHQIGQHVRILEASADVQRYRQGFFALLGLICMLLTVLGLCVYLLRRDSLHRAPSNGATPAGYRL